MTPKHCEIVKHCENIVKFHSENIVKKHCEIPPFRGFHNFTIHNIPGQSLRDFSVPLFAGYQCSRH